MQEYKEFLKQEAEEFREKGHAFLEGGLTRAEFKGMSGGMGCYSQRDGKSFMIRLRTPSGVISLPHYHAILGYAKQYGLEKLHITTRQAVQLHNLTIDQVCDIMKDAIDQDLFTRGGGGNFPRNVSLSPMAGAAPGEAFDVTPFALQTGQYFLRNAPGYKLPRKLKVAFSSGRDDTAFATINDLGFLAVEEGGRPYFKLWLAGGMGGGPAVGIPFDELVKPEEVLFYVEAMVRLFMAEGDYEHKAKARIRFIPRRMGEEAFLDCYKKHVDQVKKECSFEGITPEAVTTDAWEPELPVSDVVIPQRQKGRYAVVLHPVCGHLMLEDAEKLNTFLDTCENPQLRLGMMEDLFVRNLTRQEAERLLEQMKESMMSTPVDMTVTCIGTPICQMGVLESQKLCHGILDSVQTSGVDKHYLPRICISGCPNSCSRHQVAELGFAGRIKPVDGQRVEAFDCYVGGVVSQERTAMGTCVGTIPADQIPGFVAELGRKLEETELSFAEMLEKQPKLVQTLAGQYVI